MILYEYCCYKCNSISFIRAKLPKVCQTCGSKEISYLGPFSTKRMPYKMTLELGRGKND